MFKKKKALGQHFIYDQDIHSAIVEFSELTNNEVVVEIGPGFGNLTTAIYQKKPKTLLIIEKDQELTDKIRGFGLKNTQIICGDALLVNFEEILGEDFAKAHVIANLPYNIGTTLVLGWLENPRGFQSITVMLQKEVSLRLIAQTKSSDFCRNSLLAQHYFEATHGFEVDRSSFSPPPKVDSVVVRFNRRAANEIEKRSEISWQLLGNVARLCFKHPRRTILNNLKSEIPEAATLLDSLQVAHTKRPHELEVREIHALCRSLKSRLEKIPAVS